MDGSLQIGEAQDFIYKGEFEKASDILGYLLESNPQNPELISGFYMVNWWKHRKVGMDLRKSGRELAVYLIGLWEEFEVLIKERSYQQSLFIPVLRDVILGNAADQFRKSFQSEGGNVISDDLLLQLSRCLLRLGDNENAADILVFARSHYKTDPEYLYMIAESFARLGDKESRIKGWVYYRSALLLDHRKIKLEYVESMPAKKVVNFLQKKYDLDQTLIIEWFPAWYSIELYNEKLPALEKSEQSYVNAEIQRLQGQVATVKKDFHESLVAYLVFMLIIKSKETQASERNEVLLEIGRLAPDLGRLIK